MRKRRRLADKLTIMVCAVLVAVSAFFYAPMEVSAEEISLTTSGGANFGSAGSGTGRFSAPMLGNFGIVNLYPDAVTDSFYEVTLHLKLNMNVNYNLWWTNIAVLYGDVPLFVSSNSDEATYTKVQSIERDVSVVLSSEQINNNDFSLVSRYIVEQSITKITYNLELFYDIVSVSPLSSFDSDDYQNGYNAGYSAGEQAGYGNGYSNGFADGEASVDTGEIYNQGFNAGKDSVDTESYYDAGYQAGYQVAYSEGYESGYDEGYQSAMDRIVGWGADTAQYPLLLSESSEPFNLQFDFIEEGSDEFVYSDYSDVNRYFPDIDFNPNHTYKLDFTYHEFKYDFNTFFTSSFSFWLYWGDSSFPLLVSSKNDITSTVFIPGDRVGNGLRFRCDLGQIESNGSIDTLHYYLKGCTLGLYDMGPSGDTQNHIANQTDKLTNGFNDSKGNSVNNDFSTGLNDFETAEDSLFATATTGLKDFTFFDFQSVPAMVTGMSFVGSIMSGWFTQAGGASGVGIVLSILFSIMLVAMVLGLYRWYQSKGGKD